MNIFIFFKAEKYKYVAYCDLKNKEHGYLVTVSLGLSSVLQAAHKRQWTILYPTIFSNYPYGLFSLQIMYLAFLFLEKRTPYEYYAMKCYKRTYRNNQIKSLFIKGL